MRKKLFILGGNGDIGKAIVYKFRNFDFDIISPTSKECDLRDFKIVDSYLSKNIDKIRGTSVFIHSAGVNDPKNFCEYTIQEIDEIFKINTISFIRVLQFFLPILKKHKTSYVLAISSLYSIFSRKGRMAYSVSKHALNAIIKTAALELGKYGIKVNALSPGFVDTKLTRKNNPVSVIEDIKRKIPLGFLASPKDIANTAYYLCSEENTYITGQNIVVDGGYSIGGFQK
jgi:3-oxoacyl-[acyl-carrier protein] reductase